MRHMLVEIYGLTDIGLRRELNEDSYSIFGFENGAPKGFCVLADGMGGHNAGEVASSIAVEVITDELASSIDETDSKKIALNIAAAIDMANSKIYQMSLTNPDQAGMGTTTVVAYVCDNLVRIANIGDSRAYAVSDKEICRITIDHSVVEELIQSGSIKREDAFCHPERNIITRALGTEKYVDADFFDYEPTNGEVIMMCSDGLTDMIGDDEIIKDIIINSENIESAVRKLVDTAKEYDGIDNITVIAMRFSDGDTENGTDEN